jgi:hypothetical protein
MENLWIERKKIVGLAQLNSAAWRRMVGCLACKSMMLHGLDGKNAVYEISLGCLVGWAGKIRDKFRKLPDFPAQNENGWYGSPTVSRPIPVTPYPVSVPFTIFLE